MAEDQMENQDKPEDATQAETTDQAQAADNAEGAAVAVQDSDFSPGADAIAGVGEVGEQLVFTVAIDEAGPATKKITIEVPQEQVAKRLEKQFGELKDQAQIPGFRPGHAPLKLIEKRFGGDVRDQVKGQIVSESYQQAMEQNSIQPMGEPEFENEDLELPTEGPLSYTFTVEVQPEFLLPAVAGLKIRRPKLEITDAHIEDAMVNLRQQQSPLVPVEDRGVKPNDHIVCDVVIKVGDETVVSQTDGEIEVKPMRVAGITIDDLPDHLAGLTSGEAKDISVTLPETFSEAEHRGKEAVITFTIKEIKEVQLIDIDDEFLEDLGFDSEEDVRNALRLQMEDRVGYDVQQAMRAQVCEYLLQQIHIDLPPQLSERQTERIVARRHLELMARGMPEAQAAQAIEELRTGASDKAVRELKLFFILQRVAQQQSVSIRVDDLIGRIAIMASQRGQRPEKLKQEMAKDNTLQHLYLQLLEQKALDKIIEMASVEDFDPGEGDSTPIVEAPATTSEVQFEDAPAEGEPVSDAGDAANESSDEAKTDEESK